MNGKLTFMLIRVIFKHYDQSRNVTQTMYHVNLIESLLDDDRPSPSVESHFGFKSFEGYINVGDGCWRQNVLVTTLECW